MCAGNCKKSCCCETRILRYQGVDIPQLGIENGMTYDTIFEQISEYVQGFESIPGSTGNGISSVDDNEDGTFTFNFTDGTDFTTSNLTGPAGPQELLVQNTLIVSKNGNNTIAQRNDWSKPFLTIGAANAASQVGDIIIVYPGTYNESDIALSNRYYDLKRGVIITGSGAVSDSTGAKNIHISGEGIFTAPNPISTIQPTSKIYLRCLEVNSNSINGISIINAANIDIKGKLLTCTAQYGLTLRGDSEGNIEFDTIDCSASGLNAPAIYVTNHNPTTFKKITVKCNLIKSNSNSGVVALFSNNTNSNICVKVSKIQQVASTVGGNTCVLLNTGGQVKFECADINTNANGIIADTGKTFVSNTTINSDGNCFNVSGSALVKLQNTNSVRVATNVPDNYAGIINLTSGGIYLKDSIVVNRGLSSSLAHAVFIEPTNIVSPNIMNTKIIVSDLSAFSFISTAAQTISVQNILTSNVGLQSNVTNNVAGAVLISSNQVKEDM